MKADREKEGARSESWGNLITTGDEDEPGGRNVASWMSRLGSLSRMEWSIVSNAADGPSKMRTEK